ncbi:MULTISPECIES: SDR family NAD(P)-dependent oxidoreductase [Fusobacterium]|uniref:SDR family NAD(P)-dependent oxidoreductase n=1 Tax=Fusobacterium TaxID=848 RepID=UPI0008A44C20|nr:MULTISPECIES: SDR family NAD(P)-dependent oxidoreductase [Fusobacterium]OFL81944.1 3-oxoacyl-ACP reductase [Fusobacterium sp. HMSC073F01]
MKIFIAGGTSGIGLAIAEKYLEQGHEVAVCGRNKEKIDKIKKVDKLKIYKFDTYDRKSFEIAVNDFSNGKLDIMIASAGNYSNSRTRRLTQEEAVNMLKVNISGTINAFEIAREIMLKNKKGHIAAISSVAALLEYPGASVYSKSKRVVINICEAYREALSDFGIGVTAIIPGYIDTLKLRELNNNDVSKKPFIMSEEYTADIIIKSIEKNREKIIFPLKMKIVVSILSLLPKKILSLILLRKSINK